MEGRSDGALLLFGSPNFLFFGIVIVLASTTASPRSGCLLLPARSFSSRSLARACARPSYLMVRRGDHGHGCGLLMLWFFLRKRARATEVCEASSLFFFLSLFSFSFVHSAFSTSTSRNSNEREAPLPVSLPLPFSLSLSFSPFFTETTTADQEPNAKTASTRRRRNMTAARKPSPPPPPPQPPPPPPFRFGARRDRIDWGALHGVDIERMVCLWVFFSFRRGSSFSSAKRPLRGDISHLSLSLARLFCCLSLISHTYRRPPLTSTRWRSASRPSRTATWTPSPEGSSRR